MDWLLSGERDWSFGSYVHQAVQVFILLFVYLLPATVKKFSKKSKQKNTAIIFKGKETRVPEIPEING